MSAVLLVASPGGHVDELYDWQARLGGAGSPRVWVTARTAQTASLLRDERVEFVPPVGSREGIKAAGSLPGAIRLIRRLRPTLVVSTGAALALPYMIAARLHRVPTHYIESATRLDEPSLTGRMATRIPGVTLHHQGHDWAAAGWHPAGSVFDRYEGSIASSPDRAHQPDLAALRIVVTLGSERYPFVRALQSLQETLGVHDDVLWQLGHTPRIEGLHGSVHQWIPYEELMSAIEGADVVVCHAGVGSLLSVLRSGRCPVALARLAVHGEHVDDHQLELARSLEDRGLAVAVDPDEDVGAAIAAASHIRITLRPNEVLSTLL